MDKTIALHKSFQDLDLKKSQVDTILNQLSRDWEREVDSLVTLLANSMVVHTDIHCKQAKMIRNTIATETDGSWPTLLASARMLAASATKDQDRYSFLNELLRDSSYTAANDPGLEYERWSFD